MGILQQTSSANHRPAMQPRHNAVGVVVQLSSAIGTLLASSRWHRQQVLPGSYG